MPRRLKGRGARPKCSSKASPRELAAASQASERRSWISARARRDIPAQHSPRDMRVLTALLAAQRPQCRHGGARLALSFGESRALDGQLSKLCAAGADHMSGFFDQRTDSFAITPGAPRLSVTTSAFALLALDADPWAWTDGPAPVTVIAKLLTHKPDCCYAPSMTEAVVRCCPRFSPPNGARTTPSRRLSSWRASG